MIFRGLLLWILGISVALGEVTLESPATAKMGGQLTVTVNGAQPRDFVSIVPRDSREGFYAAYQYASKPGQLKLQVPARAGEYEVRVLGASTPYPTLAKQSLTVESVTATLEGPAQVAAGAKFEVKWTGPGNVRDYVGIGEAKAGSPPYISYAYTNTGSTISLNAPDQAGEYELRYFLAEGNTVIASRPITVGAVSASVAGPVQATAGSKFPITWTGPDNPRDFITLVKAGSPEKQYDRYVYTSKGSPVEMAAPDRAGEYELRYLTAQSYATLARAPLTVTPVAASLQGPAEAVAGGAFSVSWKGPANQRDYITVVRKDAHEGASGNYAYVETGNPLKVLAPLEAGDYELRYSTAQSHATLARAPIRITPGKQEPGLVTVTASNALADGGGVEIILDASGSMLQRIGAQRRIDIAKQTLTRLASSVIPAGTPFAMRVFGREVDSCQTDLEIPLSPLNVAAVTAKIGALEAKNNARTPIGASLEMVARDLGGVTGERLVILLTDGEETCGGDPAAAIQNLKKTGASVRVNIVGFAIDDEKLAASFRHWAEAGSGLYFDAKDAAGLNDALTGAMRPGFEIINAQGQLVAEGFAGADPVSVMPDSYTVRLKGRAASSKPIAVRAKETSVVQF